MKSERQILLKAFSVFSAGSPDWKELSSLLKGKEEADLNLAWEDDRLLRGLAAMVPSSDDPREVVDSFLGFGQELARFIRPSNPVWQSLWTAATRSEVLAQLLDSLSVGVGKLEDRHSKTLRKMAFSAQMPAHVHAWLTRAGVPQWSLANVVERRACCELFEEAFSSVRDWRQAKILFSIFPDALQHFPKSTNHSLQQAVFTAWALSHQYVQTPDCQWSKTARADHARAAEFARICIQHGMRFEEKAFVHISSVVISKSELPAVQAEFLAFTSKAAIDFRGETLNEGLRAPATNMNSSPKPRF